MTRRETHVVAELQVEPSTSATVELRASLRDLLGASPYAARLDDIVLAATELVTNALLHGRQPISVRVAQLPDRLRIAVHDTHGVSPSFSLLDPTAITGRGLMVVSSVADRWGVEPDGSGKSVWIEVFPEEPDKGDGADVAALLASWGDELETDPALEWVRVVLTDMDVAAMTSAETHVEAALRELALVVNTASSDPVLVEQGQRVLEAAEPFDGVRADLKRQLASATAAGRRTCDLELTITRRDAESVRDYGAAMDAADRMARTGRLLLQESDPLVVATRKEYLRRILAQLAS